MTLVGYARWARAFGLVGVISSVFAVSAWGEAGDNGQSFMVEGLWLTTDDADVIALTAPAGVALPAVPFALVTTDDLDLDDAGGARVTAQFDAWGAIWQVSAFAVSSFEADFVITGLDPSTGDTSTTYAKFIGGADPSAFEPENSDELHQLDLNLESQLWGAEFSWVRPLDDYGWENLDFLFGFRYIHYGEELHSLAFDEVGDLIGGNGIDRMHIEVDNDLVGVQIGLQGMWHLGPNVAIGGTLKGGVAANFIARDRSFSADDINIVIPNYANSHDDTGFAQFAEFNPRLDITLSNSATLTIGGTVLWINDTSRAAAHYQSAADVTDANLRDDQDELFYGASVGLRLALD